MNFKEFLVEFVDRFFSKTPRFFKILKIIGIVGSIITGIPLLLEYLTIPIPVAVEIFQSKILLGASAATYLVSQLTKKKVIETTEEITVVKEVAIEEPETNKTKENDISISGS